MNLQEAVQDVVERARLGDENAMAQLVLVGDQARKGSPQATRSYNLIQEYIKRNPFTEFNFGDEILQEEQGKNVNQKLILLCFNFPESIPDVVLSWIPYLVPLEGPLGHAAMILSYGPVLYNLTTFSGEDILGQADVVGILGKLQEPEQEAFLFGMEAPLAKSIEYKNDRCRNHACAGYVVSRAMKLQAVRNGAPIGLISKEAAWELGE